MGTTVVCVDADGAYYALDADLIGPTLTAADLDAARMSAESRAAVETALGYERAGAFGLLTPERELHVGDRILRVVGTFG